MPDERRQHERDWSAERLWRLRRNTVAGAPTRQEAQHIVALREAAEREAALRKRAEHEAAQREAAAREAARRREHRLREYLASGLNERRANALSGLAAGPFAVVATGISKRNDPKALKFSLSELGYTADEIPRLLERIEHIAPETVAFDLDQSPAVAVKKRLEAGGARVRIKEADRRNGAQGS